MVAQEQEKEIKKMTKQEQQSINDMVEKMIEYTLNDREQNEVHFGARLRTCNASILYTDNFFYLRSYRTIVAFIDRNTGEGYDILRKVYGYTATSSQHISKFMNDYNAIKVWMYK